MINIFIRACIIYVLVVVVTRVSGKVEVGQMKPSELVFSLLIADLAATPLANDNVPLLHGLLPILALLLGQMTFAVLTLKSRKMRALLVGRPAILIRHGKIDEAELSRQRFCVDDLLEQLRISGYSSVSQIDTAILEPSGDLSVFPWKKDAPPAAQDLQLSLPESGICFTLITDGHLSHSNLRKSGHDLNWLAKILRQNGVRSPQETLLLTVDEAGAVAFQKRSAPYKNNRKKGAHVS